MARLDLPDVARDEDTQTSRRGGITRSEHRDRAEALSAARLVDVAEGAFVIAHALELLADRGCEINPRTLRNLAGVLRRGLRGTGG